MSEATWERTRRSVVTLARGRFAGEGGALDEALLDGARLRTLVSTQALCAAAGD
jgi:hypothetical protein